MVIFLEMKTNQNHTISTHFEELKNYANKISPDFDLEDIHHFRTNTKKLRSILRLNGKGKNFLGRKFLKLYHIAGELRNAQLLLVSLTKQGIRLPRFALWLATYIGIRQAAWKKHFAAAVFGKLEKKIDVVKGPAPTLQELQAFFKGHIAEIIRIAQEAVPADEALHTIRKRIKDLVYVRQWCQHSWPAGWQGTRRYSLTALQRLADVAGNFNDERTGLDLLAAYLGHEKHPKATRAAKIFERTSGKTTTQNKAALIAAVRGFANKFPGGKHIIVGQP